MSETIRGRWAWLGCDLGDEHEPGVVIGTRQEMQEPRMTIIRSMRPRTAFFTLDPILGKMRMFHNEEQLAMLFNQAEINWRRQERGETLICIERC